MEALAIAIADYLGIEDMVVLRLMSFDITYDEVIARLSSVNLEFDDGKIKDNRYLDSEFTRMKLMICVGLPVQEAHANAQS